MVSPNPCFDNKNAGLPQMHGTIAQKNAFVSDVLHSISTGSLLGLNVGNRVGRENLEKCSQAEARKDFCLLQTLSQ